MSDPDRTLHGAYAACRRLARQHYENFPVASYLVPKDKRDALAAIYTFARCADDFADEPVMSGDEHQNPQEWRLGALAKWRHKLAECYEGRAKEPIFVALGDAAHRFGLSQQHFDNLLRAFELDVRVNRHPDFSSLLSYCACSANPVGRLVLELFDHREPELHALSDDICTALQLTNFWQDVAVDLERDRIYLPLEDLNRFHISMDDLHAWAAGDSHAGQPTRLPASNSRFAATQRWRDLMAFEIAQTRLCFEKGKVLCEKITPVLRRQLRLTWRAGLTILDRIEAAGYDVFRYRPELSRWDFLRLYLKAREPILGSRV